MRTPPAGASNVFTTVQNKLERRKDSKAEVSNEKG